jgi:hypothetical protein
MLNELINDAQVLNIYQWGSRIYGCATEKSDYDYIIVVTDDYSNFQDNIEIDNSHYNFYKLSVWKDMINKNRIEALECSFIDTKYIVKETVRFSCTINIIELRKSISQVCSNSYDKCRKKLTIQKDYAPYIAKKSLWHSIRILLYGIQCAKYGKIVDYTEANKYYNDIVMNDDNTWDYYKEHWHMFCNNLRTEFRKCTEKEWNAWSEQQCS